MICVGYPLFNVLFDKVFGHGDWPRRETESEEGEASASHALALQERPEVGSISPRVGRLKRGVELRSGLRFLGTIVSTH